ncbi:MAG: Caffeoyl-CoA O-methyltransferase [Gammaproteobacteria bacterium]|jgi:caffeoyl-CoA O-methyltransferase|nr:Caffeoyl-CoA O-methyltransferase [Gammaproteobacteria bacterium]
MKNLEDYAIAYTKPESALLSEIAKDVQNKPGSQMLSGPLVSQFLKMLIKMTAAYRVLDIGTFTGYSAVSMAEALPENGLVISIESSQPTLEAAKSYFAQSLHAQKIRPILGEALEVLPQLSETFDLIFIDADKSKVIEYYELALSRLKSGGIIVIDDVLWRGEVLEVAPADKRAVAMQKLNQHILEDNRVENLILPIRHGLNLVLKK